MTAAARLGAACVALLACTGGAERPKRLASVGKGAKLLAAADGRVFWVRGKTVSWWDPTRGEARDLALEGADWASPAGVAADASGLFFVHHDRLEHLQIPREGTKAFLRTRLAPEHANGVVRDGDCAFVLNGDVECRGHGTILGFALADGATCPTADVPANGLQPLAFAGDARRFYWTDTGCGERASPTSGISMLERASGRVTRLVPHEWGPELALGARGVYWRGRAGIRRVSPDGPLDAQTAVAGTVHAFAVDGGIIYYAADDGIHWVAETGGRDRLIAGTAGVRQLVVGPRHLCWISPDDDVVRAPRPH